MPDDETAVTLSRGNAVPVERDRRYDLAALIDLAQRNNPETREAWERARQAALAVGLAETSYVPQIAAEVVGGFQHTPLPIPSNLIARGWFTSDTREVVPMLTAKWLLFDFGQRDSTVEAAQATSFVADVAFTGAHEKLIFAISKAYFAIGATRGRLHVAEQALKSAEIVEDAVADKRAHELATVVELAQAKRQTAQARFNLEHAKGADNAAYSTLVAAIGVAPDAPIQIADSSEKPLPPAPAGDVDQLVRDALSARPDIVAAFGKLHAARRRHCAVPRRPITRPSGSKRRLLSEFRRPQLRWQPLLHGQRAGRQHPGQGEGLPLFDGGAREARISAAHSQVAEARMRWTRARTRRRSK